MVVIVTTRRVVNKAKRRQCNYLNDLDFGRGELYIKKVAIQAVPVAHVKNETKHFFTTDLVAATLSQLGLSVSTRLQSVNRRIALPARRTSSSDVGGRAGSWLILFGYGKIIIL